MGAPHAVYAVALTNTSITGTQFGAFLGSPLTGISLNTASYYPGIDPTDTVNVLSRVFAGIGTAAGTNVYLYQVEHESPSSTGSGFITQLNFDWLAGTPQTLAFGGSIGTSVNSFFVTSAGPTSTGPFDAMGLPGGFSFVGTESPSTSTFFPDATPNEARFEFAQAVDPIFTGETSYILGLFSPQEPALLSATVVDTGSSGSGTVYSPVPEPSTLLLLAMGFAGIVIYTGFRERRKGEGNSLRTHG